MELYSTIFFDFETIENIIRIRYDLWVKPLVVGYWQTHQEASAFRAFAGNIALMKHTQPLWVMMENVDMDDITEDGSNGAMIHHALDDAGYADRSLFWYQWQRSNF